MMRDPVETIGMTSAGCLCRCGHAWMPRDRSEKPAICPRCKSTHWHMPAAQAQKERTSGQVRKVDTL